MTIVLSDESYLSDSYPTGQGDTVKKTDREARHLTHFQGICILA